MAINARLGIKTERISISHVAWTLAELAAITRALDSERFRPSQAQWSMAATTCPV